MRLRLASSLSSHSPASSYYRLRVTQSGLVCSAKSKRNRAFVLSHVHRRTLFSEFSQTSRQRPAPSHKNTRNSRRALYAPNTKLVRHFVNAARLAVALSPPPLRPPYPRPATSTKTCSAPALTLPSTPRLIDLDH